MDFLRKTNSLLVEFEISFSDLPHRPVHRFFHEISVVGRAAFEVREKTFKNFVRGFLVVHSELSHHHETGPSDKFPFILAPLDGFCDGIGGFVKQNTAACVAHGPVVKVLGPPVHLNRRDFRRIVDQARQGACLKPAGCPQLSSKGVVLVDLSCKVSKWRCAYAENFSACDAKSGHSFNIPAAPEGSQAFEDVRYIRFPEFCPPRVMADPGNQPSWILHGSPTMGEKPQECNFSAKML